MDQDGTVADYLATLEASASGLDPERRTELVAEVREHIGLALAEAGAADDATIRMVLDRLGAPDEIVAAETGARPPSRSDAAMTSDEQQVIGLLPLSVETRALIWLTVGAVVLPWIGPVLGLWTAASSTRWTLGQKRTATLIVVVLLAMPSLFLIPALFAGEITWVYSSGGFLIPFVLLSGILAAAYLWTSSSVVVRVLRKQ
ncbi:MAG: hypothetical protein ABI562_05730 [Chloroflexota bacterium]